MQQRISFLFDISKKKIISKTVIIILKNKNEIFDQFSICDYCLVYSLYEN